MCLQLRPGAEAVLTGEDPLRVRQRRFSMPRPWPGFEKTDQCLLVAGAHRFEQVLRCVSQVDQARAGRQAAIVHDELPSKLPGVRMHRLQGSSAEHWFRAQEWTVSCPRTGGVSQRAWSVYQRFTRQTSDRTTPRYVHTCSDLRLRNIPGLMRGLRTED